MNTDASHAGGSIAAGISVEQVCRSGLLDIFEIKLLVAHALRLTRVQLITQGQRALNEAEASAVGSLITRRQAGEPIAYLMGTREFYGLELEVSPAVLIPRPETELLVELALERLAPNGKVLDMGTGSGAIAIALANTRSDAQVSALDASPAALEIARRNAQRHHVTVDFLLSDWYQALGEQRFGLIVSNPPYIEQGDAHLSQGDLRFEPVDALTDHADGLSAIRQIVGGAPAHLLPQSWLLMEHGYDQAAAVRALLEVGGFLEVQSWRDLAGIERVSGGRLA